MIKAEWTNADALNLQPTCNNLATDTISRQAAIDALDKECRCTDKSDDLDGLETAMLIIENLPSAQSDNGYSDGFADGYKRGLTDAHEPEPQWIPCVDGNEPKVNAECWISTNAKYVKRASYAPKANNQPNGFIVTDGSFAFYEYGKYAKAWMPYTKEPEPYREEGD